MESTLVYLHGYGSSSQSDKVRELRKAFPGTEAPDIPNDFAEAESFLEAWIQERLDQGKFLILCGTSLGGYWATRLSNRFLLPALIINPSCQPAKTLFHLHANKYPDLTVDSGVPRIVLLAKDDDVLDYRIAEKLFEDKAHVKLFENGGHRFQVINTITENLLELDSNSLLP